MLKTLLVPIHKAGWPFIALFAAGTAVLGAVLPPLGVAGVLMTVWCV